MKNKTYELVRDLFIFSVFTGLSYADVKNLTTDNLQMFFDGNLWIITRRRKTNTYSNIRLLDVPKRIIEKYKGLTGDSRVLPVPSNSCCNAKLKKSCESAKFYSLENKQHFEAKDIQLKIDKDPDNHGKLRIPLIGQNILDRFKQKSQEVKHVTSYYQRPSIKPEESKSKGIKM